MSSIVENLKEIAGSLPDGVKLVAVSKTKPVEAIEEAYKACLLYTSDAADE